VSKKEFEQAIKNDLGDFNITDDSEELQQPAIERTKRIKNARWITIELIQPDLDQPRKKFDEDSIQQLAQSIKEHGILQPIVVEKIESNGTYKIVHGERRYRAACLIQVNEMPCIIQSSLETTKKYAQQIVENIQREDLSPIDKARALLEYKEMLGEAGTWADVQKVVGISESRRKQFVALLKLPEDIQNQIVSIGKRPSKNQITEKHARALLMLNKFPEKQMTLFEQIKNRDKPIIGDKAIEIAKDAKGKKMKKIFKISYSSTNELIEKIELTLGELKANRCN
jgi:ParB family transcriptional regulator, chromosome partitioning protein